MALMHRLFQLQQLDRELKEIQSRLQQLSRILAQAPEVEAARLQMEVAQEEAEQRRQAFERAELKVEQLRERLDEVIVQLTSGQVRNPKQVQLLYEERLYLEGKLEQAEEIAIQALMAWEEAQATMQQARTRLQEVLKERSRKEAAWRSEMRRLCQRKQDLEARRQALSQRIPQEALSVYQKLLEQKAGLAVAEVQDGACSACGAMLSSALQQQAANPASLTSCPQCGRLLYTA